MNITFYANGDKSYIGNNGGSRTILKSAEVLREIGHRCDVVSKKDTFTWSKHPPCIKDVSSDTDALIAVSARDVDKMCKKFPNHNKYWWIRGIEKWQFQEKELVEKAKKVKCIVNAMHVKNWLAEYGISSTLCYSGMDDWSDFKIGRKKDGKTTIGCLYNKLHKTKGWNSFKELANEWGRENFTYVAFGNDTPNAPWLNCLVKQPSRLELERLYNICDVWFSDSTLEGFHNVPAEAAMCGCLVMCNDKTHNGMGDYADEDTARIFHSKEEMFEQSFDFSKVEKMKALIAEKIGTREQNMKKLVEVCSG